ncbi:uncharacterized protein [Macrobrachium rosenbergii]|uniref:uncharacterized protein isoform X2 n=1 Tax=Macrobrachium rosenbergii TaxID=79674 RepID=UPI0034D39948
MLSMSSAWSFVNRLCCGCVYPQPKHVFNQCSQLQQYDGNSTLQNSVCLDHFYFIIFIPSSNTIRSHHNEYGDSEALLSLF